MRRIYLFCLFFLLTLLPAAARANTWGVLRDVPEETTFSVYAVDNLIDKRPIRYAVSEKISTQHKRIFEKSILKWPA